MAAAAGAAAVAPPTPGAARNTPTAAGGTLKITQIPLEKDVWENIAPIIQKTFQAVCANLGSVKRWADRHEERAKRQEELYLALEVRVEEHEVAAQARQQRLDSLSEEIKTVFDDSRRQMEFLTQCLGSVMASVREVFAKMAKGLDVELESSQEEEDALATLRAGENVTESLQVLCNLEHVISALESGFERSTSWREAQEGRYGELKGQVQELYACSEATRERLLSWRERIKENTHVLNAMGTSLGDTQAAVRELQAVQVRHHDIEEAVSQQAEALLEQIGLAESKAEELSGRMEGQVAEVERHIQEVQQHTDEALEVHGNQVAQLLQQSLNPINAYLNTMHVKADVVRVELDSLNEKVPKLAASIEDVSAELGEKDAAGRVRAEDLDGRLDKLVLSLAQWGEQTQLEHSGLARELSKASEDLEGQIAGVRSSLEATAEALEAAKKGELAKVAKDLDSLEQKVAKWVYAHPLPAKVSEARLFSLEAQLAQEMEARLHLEHHVKGAPPLGREASGGSMSARHPVALPQLHKQRGY